MVTQTYTTFWRLAWATQGELVSTTTYVITDHQFDNLSLTPQTLKKKEEKN